jgi:hypothetical protein
MKADAPRVNALVPLGLFAVLATVFWGVFVPERGLVGETIWIELSQSRPGLAGFIYPYDATRRLMSVPFHLAYLVSDGSYLPLYLLYGVLLWATGALTWLIVRELVPSAPLLAMLAGAFAIIHGADRSIAFVAMIVVRQSVVAVLFATWAALRGWNRQQPWMLALAAGAQAVALWTYEPAFAVLALVPLIFWTDRLSRRLFAWSIGWYVVPAIFVASLAVRYLFAEGNSYQAAAVVLPPVDAAARALARFSYDGLAFWRWPAPWWDEAAAMCQSLVVDRAALPLAAATVVFATCAFVFGRRPDILPPVRPVAVLQLLAFVAAAYAPYILVSNIDAPGISGLWRVHFYAALPIGFALAGACVYAARTRFQPVALLAATLVVASGLAAGLMSQLDGARRWTAYRTVIAGILSQAPRVRDDTFVALLNVPNIAPVTLCPAHIDDPFADTMWFNSALQLMYPGTTVAGSYWREDGSMSGSVRYRFDQDGVNLERTSVTVEGTQFGYDHVVAFDFDGSHGPRLLETLPPQLAPFRAAGQYRPASRIVAGTPPAETLARFDLK